MDRVIVHPGQLPAAEDFLTIQRETQRGLARIIGAITGGAPIVDGIECSPTSPGSMSVSLSSGTIYAPGVMDGTSFGILPAEISGAMRAGGYGGGTLPLTAPASAGTDVIYLIQCTFQETDTDPAVLDYYNAADPSQPWSGPGNSGQQQFTKRSARAVVSVKAGAPAAAGTAVPPAADLGWYPLWLVRVGAGSTVIASEHISAHPNAPRFKMRLTNGLTLADLAGYALQSSLNAEAATRAAVDGNLNTAINSEINARSQGDTILHNSIAANIAVVNNNILFLRNNELSGDYNGHAGRQRFPSGLYLFFGQGRVAASGNSTAANFWAFDQQFPTGCMCVIATIGGTGLHASGVQSNSLDGYLPSIAITSPAATGFTVHIDNLQGWTTKPINKDVPFNYIALGW